MMNGLTLPMPVESPPVWCFFLAFIIYHFAFIIEEYVLRSLDTFDSC